MNAGIHRKDGIPGGSKYAKAVEGREAEARQKVHRRTLRPDTGRVSLENRVQGAPARMGEEIPHVRGERAGTEGEDGSRSLGHGRGCPALPLRREKQGPEYGVSPGTVSNWCRAYSQSGTDLVKSIGERRLSPMPEKFEVGSEEFERLSDKEKLKILREEYEYLRTENAVLKKLRALGERKEAARKKRR